MSFPFTPRSWQEENYKRFTLNPKKLTWFVHAATGVGKTLSTGMLMDGLMSMYPNLITLIVAPLDAVREGWVSTLDVDEDDKDKPHFGWATETKIDDFDPANDINFVTTYPGLSDNIIMSIQMSGRPVAIIFDEIHRLEESIKEGERSSGWSRQAMRAVETLDPVKIVSLTATPWREGNGVCLPKAIAEYYPDDYEDKLLAGIIKADMTWTYGDELKLPGDEPGVVYATFKPTNALCERLNEGKWEPMSTETMPEFDPVHKKYVPFGMRSFVNFKTKAEFNQRPYAKIMIERAIRTLNIIRQRKYHGIKGAIFAMDIKSAKTIHEVMTKDFQQDAIIMHSEDKKEETKQKLKSIRSADGAAWVISVGMIGEGVDIPAIKVVVDFSDELTIRSIVQRWGRGLRKVLKHAPDVNAKIYHINHSVLRFVSESLKKEIRIAKRDNEGGGGGGGPGEEKPCRGFEEGEDIGSLLDEERYEKEVNDLAEWLYGSRDSIADFTDALKIARELCAMRILPPGYVRKEPDLTSPEKQSRTAKQERKDIVKSQRKFIVNLSYPGDDRGLAYTNFNKSVKTKLIKDGHRPGTNKYKKAMAKEIDRRSRLLGWGGKLYDAA